MRLRDTILLRHKLSQSTIIYASGETQGKKIKGIGKFLSDNDDVFVLAEGLKSPHKETASMLAATSAIWSIKLLKSKHSYWRDKKATGGRLMRSVNLTLYNKRREEGYSDGIEATLSVLLFGEKQFYVYSIGTISIYLFRGKEIIPLHSSSNSAVGREKKAPDNGFHTDIYHSLDLFLLINTNVETNDLQKFFSGIPYTSESLTTKTQEFIKNQQKKSPKQYMTMSVIYCL